MLPNVLTEIIASYANDFAEENKLSPVTMDILIASTHAINKANAILETKTDDVPTETSKKNRPSS